MPSLEVSNMNQIFHMSTYFIRRAVYAIAAYISLVGIITFSLFILEESIQMATFGTWPASDAQDWQLVKNGCDVISSANRTMKILNYSLGWIQPFAFLSYRAYGRSTDYYLDAMRAKIFAHDPSVMIGERVTITVSLKGGKVTMDEGGWLLQPSRKSIFVLFPYSLIPREASLPALSFIRVTGLVASDATNRIVFHVDLIHPADS
jgi:hypothetical protein